MMLTKVYYEGKEVRVIFIGSDSSKIIFGGTTRWVDNKDLEFK